MKTTRRTAAPQPRRVVYVPRSRAAHELNSKGNLKNHILIEHFNYLKPDAFQAHGSKTSSQLAPPTPAERSMYASTAAAAASAVLTADSKPAAESPAAATPPPAPDPSPPPPADPPAPLPAPPLPSSQELRFTRFLFFVFVFFQRLNTRHTGALSSQLLVARGYGPLASLVRAFCDCVIVEYPVHERRLRYSGRELRRVNCGVSRRPCI